MNTLDQLSALVQAEAPTQNLIAASTIDSVWSRHIVDSLQLLSLAPEQGQWVDVGSGAGFPGMVAAIARPQHTVLIESRRLRADFLRRVAEQLDLPHVEVVAARAEMLVAPPATVISARAVASLTKLFAAIGHLAGDETIWLLPKGRSAASELAEAKRTWQGSFVMQPSITDPGAAIVIARNVRRRGARS